MAAAYRALASVVMLAGFYVVALLQLAASVALVLWLSTKIAGFAAVKLAYPLFAATVGAVGSALWKAMRTKRPEPHGLRIEPEQAPELWQTLRELSEVVRTRMPDEVRLVPEVNAAVEEHARFLGLVGGRRILYIGLPLLQGMTVSQMRSVLAHELGHYSGRHTSLGAVAYRGRLAIAGTIERIGPGNPVGWVFKAYARLYRIVDNAASRRQELAADQASVQVAGPTVAASALRELPGLDAAWGFFFRSYVQAGWEAGYAPDDLFGGFGELIAARKEELDELRALEPEHKTSVWDTHPPIGQRIAAMAAMPEPENVTVDDRRAAVLLADISAAGRQLQELMVDVGDRKVLPWPEFIAAAIAATDQQQADAIFRAVVRFTEESDVTLDTVFDLVAAGRLGEFAEQFVRDATPEEAAQRFAGPMSTLLRVAAVRSDVGHWQLSWSSPASFVGRDGEPLPISEIAGLAVSPDTLAQARQQLDALGIDPAKATLVERRVTADGAGVIAGVANIKVNGAEHDLLVLDRGLVLIADPGGVDEGAKRMRELLQTVPVAELAANHRFVPYEEVATVSVTREVPVRAQIVLHDGTELSLQESWTGELLEKESRNTLLEVLRDFPTS